MTWSHSRSAQALLSLGESGLRTRAQLFVARLVRLRFIEQSAPSSWSTFDMTTLGGPVPVQLSGAVFDGQYVYFYGPDFIGRFAARSARLMPKLPGWSGSFF